MAVKGPSCDLITPVLMVDSIRLTGKYSLGYRVCAAFCAWQFARRCWSKPRRWHDV